MAEKGKYIYGIINLKNNSFDSHGINIQAEGFSFTDKGAKFSNSVYTIPHQDITAVVSDSEIRNYLQLPRDVLAKFLLRHQKIIENIMNSGLSVIPMKLGTYARNEAEIKFILNKGYTLIQNIFQKVNGKIEIDVVASWNDFASVLKEIGEEKEIKEYKEKLLAATQKITVDDKMKIGFMMKKALDEKREKYASRIHNVLKGRCYDLKKHELMDDKMVINTAFLIDKAREKEFGRAIVELNHEFEEMLNFRCVGPLPSYSFYTLEIEKIQFKDIQWARKKLKIINDFATRDEMKKSYQRAAFSYHPDKNPDTPGIEKEFNEINKAYKILINYCEACERVGKTESCSFKEGEIKKNAVLLRVKE